MGLDDAEVFHEHAAADAGEGLGSGDPLACCGGDGVGKVAFATETQTRDRRCVLVENLRII